MFNLQTCLQSVNIEFLVQRIKGTGDKEIDLANDKGNSLSTTCLVAGEEQRHKMTHT